MHDGCVLLTDELSARRSAVWGTLHTRTNCLTWPCPQANCPPGSPGVPTQHVATGKLPNAITGKLPAQPTRKRWHHNRQVAHLARTQATLALEAEHCAMRVSRCCRPGKHGSNGRSDDVCNVPDRNSCSGKDDRCSQDNDVASLAPVDEAQPSRPHLERQRLRPCRQQQS